MTTNHPISNNRSPQDPDWFSLSGKRDFVESELDLDFQMAQNPEPLPQRGFDTMSSKEAIPESTPSTVDLLAQSFIKSRERDDVFGVIEKVWSDGCSLGLNDKLEVIRKITVWDGFKFNVDCFPLVHFKACQEAIIRTSRKPTAKQFFIDNVESMNYAAKVKTINFGLLGVKEAKEVIERILDNSTDWEIVSACKYALRSICRKYYPDEMSKYDFDVADRADPETKPNWERAHTIMFRLLTEEQRLEYERKRNPDDIDTEGLD